MRHTYSLNFPHEKIYLNFGLQYIFNKINKIYLNLNNTVIFYTIFYEINHWILMRKDNIFLCTHPENDILIY